MGDIGGQILVYTLGAASFLVNIGGGAALLLVAIWRALMAKEPARPASRALVVGGVLLAAQILIALASRRVLRGSLMDPGAALLIGPALTVVALLILAKT